MASHVLQNLMEHFCFIIGFLASTATGKLISLTFLLWNTAATVKTQIQQYHMLLLSKGFVDFFQQKLGDMTPISQRLRESSCKLAIFELLSGNVSRGVPRGRRKGVHGIKNSASQTADVKGIWRGRYGREAEGTCSSHCIPAKADHHI